MSDSAIITKVKAKLIKDSGLSGFAISVDAFEGEVTLTGAVKTSDQITAYGRISQIRLRSQEGQQPFES
jgi:osmotically-inducible protein OsmY